MPLQLVSSEEYDTTFDIIAVPAIGGDPVKTWMYPDHQGPKPQTLWTDLHEARVFLFSYDRPQEPKYEGVTTYALDLLRAIKSDVDDLGRRPIHFAAFSTGGLVVKRALFTALGGIDDGGYLCITRCCFSLAFFGTPHYGSHFLSLPAYKEGVKDLFDLTRPYSSRLRAEIRQIDNLDELQRFNQKFIDYTAKLIKIWSFVDLKETVLRVKISGKEGKRGETTLRVPVVDRRSSRLGWENLTVGCEEVLYVATDHIHLPRFGDNPSELAFSQYIQGLRVAVDMASRIKAQDIYELDRRVKAEVHLFYDTHENDKTYVKLWSVEPSLRTLFAFGPAKCLGQRKELAEKTLATPTPSSHKYPHRAATTESGSQPPSPNHQQEPSDSNPDSSDAASETSSTVTYQLPDINSPRFRWIHVPANNMYWVEQIMKTIDFERQTLRLERAEREIEEPLETASEAPTEEEPPTPTKALMDDPTLASIDPLASQFQKAIGVMTSKNEQPPVHNVVEAIKHTKKAVNLIKATLTAKNERTPLLLPETAQLAEDYGERARILEAAKPQKPGEPFRPFNEVRDAVKEERRRPKLGATLLHKRVWNSKQVEARHDLPHGRFMDPYCEIFFPERSSVKQLGHTAPLTSPGDFPQMCLYFPYLHWDTLGSVKTRNDLVNARMKVVSSVPVLEIPEDLIQQLSLEHMMIWQHITNTANLPLHIRRTLDQFGYDTLKDTSNRDRDQVLYKCAKEHRGHVPQEKAESQPEPRRRFLWSRSKEQYRAQDEPKSDHQDDMTKMLMVDQLWCQVIDPRTVATFFAAREESLSPEQLRAVQSDIQKEKARLSKRMSARQSALKIHAIPCKPDVIGVPLQIDTTTGIFPEKECEEAPAKRIFTEADLRNTIHADVNGDLELAAQCQDCFDFAALAVYHAVTAFLVKENVTDRNLHVFNIFEEFICDRIEHHTVSFQNFKDRQSSLAAPSGISAVRGASGDMTNKMLWDSASTLDNSEDLSALWELLDVKDELSILKKLFDAQKGVIETMIVSYRRLDEYLHNVRASPKRSHEGALAWLQDAKHKVEEYLKRVEKLNNSRRSAQKSLEKLLDMKQSHANAFEAYNARRANQIAARQNRAIMIFTVFTIIFLPLSFFSSLFGMNVHDWNAQSSNQSLRTVFIVMFCVSVALILIAMLFAFTKYPVVIGRYLNPRRRRNNGIQQQAGEMDQDEEEAERESTLVPNPNHNWYNQLNIFSRSRNPRRSAEQIANEKQAAVA